MSMLAEHHKTLTNGSGRCSVPMWYDGLPAGFCDAAAFGAPESGQHRYDGYVPALACYHHGGPKRAMEGADA